MTDVFDKAFDAMIGLSYHIPSKFEGNNLVENIMAQHVLKRDVFAFYLSANEYDESEIIFGWIDDSKYTGDLKWYPVSNKLYWSIKIDDIRVIISQFLPLSKNQ